ncbi:MAG: phosphatidate cytidylyltransferase [Alphaproteobacteria bacterium]|jgi:phosphatidate cytidylyltransferase
MIVCGRISVKKTSNRRYKFSNLANDDLAGPLKTPSQSNLSLRVLSGAILLPAAVGLVWIGGMPFALVIALVTGGMCVEWTRMSRLGARSYVSWVAAAFAVAAVLSLQFGQFGWVGSTAVIILIGAVTLWGLSKFENIEDSVLTAISLPYVACGGASMVWIRNGDENGFDIVILLLSIVVAMDIGAYAVGRTVGGPKMAPRISPGKTWSGLFGGAICAGGVGVIASVFFELGPVILSALAGSLLGLLAQIGDLVESALKRRYGAKDSGTIIPGHGGLLDRFDGFLTVFPAAGFILWVQNGSSTSWL